MSAASRIALLCSRFIVACLLAGTAYAQQVTGLAAVQHDGFTALTWAPVAGATDYQVERTPVDALDVPTGAAVITGLWRPNRTIVPAMPTFADSGYAPGDRFQWRVRARISTTAQTYSDPVFGTTLPAPGPVEFLTEWELSGGVTYTSHANELTWTSAIDAASDRVRVVQIGQTVQGKPINLFIIGYPTPLATAQEISDSPSVGSNCNVHGNEPSGREACFILIRQLAFSNDPWVVDRLSNATVLIIPSLNGDGRQANIRGNGPNPDLNRDYGLLTQPESQAMIKFWRDYTPEVMNDAHEYGNNNTCDLPIKNTSQLNNSTFTYNEGKEGLVEGWMYDESAVSGWWPCPYPVAFSAGAQSFGNSSGHKHVIGMLVEARSGAGATRPAEGSGANNRRRKAYSHLWTSRQMLDYHRTDRANIQEAIANSIAFQASNTGPVVFDGDYTWPAVPAPHPGESPPPPNVPAPEDMLVDPPCGYLLTESQYSTKLDDGGGIPAGLWTSPAERLAMHGMKVLPRGLDTYYVAMTQPMRGMIPLVLDAVTPPRPIIAAERIATCFPISGHFSSQWSATTPVNPANAGSAVPLSFSLGGDRGMGILAPGAPTSRPVDCQTLAPLGASESTAPAGLGTLQYSAGTDTYTYVWHTSSTWLGTCRELSLGLAEGTSYARYFKFSNGAAMALSKARIDFNADNRGDVLLKHSGGAHGIWLMNGLSVSGATAISGGAGSVARLVGDYDGDGRSDIVWRLADGTWRMDRMDGLAVIGSGTLIAGGGGWEAVAHGDFNGDGKADLIWRRSTDGFHGLWLMDGVTPLPGGAGGMATPGSGFAITLVGDFNGDGKSDIVWTHGDGRAVVALMDGPLVLLSAQVLPAGTGWTPGHIGDFNADGKADLVWRKADGTHGLWLMNGVAITPSTLLAGGSGWSVKLVADLDGNGKDDLIWEKADGSVGGWLMDGATLVSSVSLMPAGAGWSVVGTEDFDGNAKDDLVWRKSDGTYAIWLMNGLGLSTSSYVLGGGTGWEVNP